MGSVGGASVLRRNLLRCGRSHPPESTLDKIKRGFVTQVRVETTSGVFVRTSGLTKPNKFNQLSYCLTRFTHGFITI